MKLNNYSDFLCNKELVLSSSGFEPSLGNKYLFPFQKRIVEWAIRKGRACLFEDCGLGKTIQQLDWGKQVSDKMKSPVLIFAPLAVSEQTKREGEKFGFSVNICKSGKDVVDGINITNYEKLHKFQPDIFSGIVLDESSILKNMVGYYRNELIDFSSFIPYRLACTATPSPNDYMELGNHSEFLGVMSYVEMLAMFFINDPGDVGKWRLKKYAKEEEFWKWVCSWAIMISNPKDIGYDEDGFDLPDLIYHEHIIPSTGKANYGFFTVEVNTLDERRKVRRESIEQRCEYAADLINSTDDQWVIWCGLNAESELLTKLIQGAVEVTGSQDQEYRIKKMLGFAEGKVNRIVSKPSIAGLGMNWQNCNKAFFVGLNDSWEGFYQAVRRIYRFGQQNIVDVHIVIEEREGTVLKNIKRKDNQAKHMIKNMINHTSDFVKKELFNDEDNNEEIQWNEENMIIPSWLS